MTAMRPSACHASTLSTPRMPTHLLDHSRSQLRGHFSVWGGGSGRAIVGIPVLIVCRVVWVRQRAGSLRIHA